LAEEVGELAHAHLKHEQGIRGLTDEQYIEQAADAVGDVVIYLASYCNSNGIDLDRCVHAAWKEVSARDWIKYPHDGRTR
jgi:NTP pyrophosphatase (non-canonical NTP hydrolase)